MALECYWLGQAGGIFYAYLNGTCYSFAMLQQITQITVDYNPCWSKQLPDPIQEFGEVYKALFIYIFATLI